MERRADRAVLTAGRGCPTKICAKISPRSSMILTPSSAAARKRRASAWSAKSTSNIRSLGNNGLEKFLEDAGLRDTCCRACMGFVLFKIDNRIEDHHALRRQSAQADFLQGTDEILRADGRRRSSNPIAAHPNFVPPTAFRTHQDAGQGRHRLWRARWAKAGC